MNVHTVLHKTILSLDNLPEELEEYRDVIANNSERLHYLLYGKDRKTNYEGPFYNNLENDDWLGITQLVICWLVETLYCAKGFPYKQNIRKLFYEYSLTNIGINLVKNLLRNGTFMSDEKSHVLGMLSLNNTTYFLNGRVEDIVEKIEGMKFWHGKKRVKKIIERDGYLSTVLNSLKGVELLEVQEELSKGNESMIAQYENSYARHDVSQEEIIEEDNVVPNVEEHDIEETSVSPIVEEHDIGDKVKVDEYETLT